MQSKQLISEIAPAGNSLSERDVAEVVARACPAKEYRDKRVLLIVPDGTRTAPVGLIFPVTAPANRRGGELLRCSDRARNPPANE